jgi:RNA polymerase sigma-70 factor (ECF subfamily)
VRGGEGLWCRVGGFDGFYEEDFPLLVGFLCKSGFEREVARDAASDAMLCAFEEWDSIRSPAAWVRRVGFRKATEQVRRTRDGVQRAMRSDWACLDEYAEDKLIALFDQARLVVSVLARLPERQRVAMAWSLDGFSDVETAEELGIEPSTVRSHLRHARERLKRIYQELEKPT